MVLGKLPVPGRPTIWITVGQGPTALAVGAGGGCLDIFTLIYPFSPLSPSLWETAWYRLKYCLKGPLNPKQPTNQPSWQSQTFVPKVCLFLGLAHMLWMKHWENFQQKIIELKAIFMKLSTKDQSKTIVLLQLEFYPSGLFTPCLRANIQIKNHVKGTKL